MPRDQITPSRPFLPLTSAIQALAWAILQGPELERQNAAEALATIVQNAV